MIYRFALAQVRCTRLCLTSKQSITSLSLLVDTTEALSFQLMPFLPGPSFIKRHLCWDVSLFLILHNYFLVSREICRLLIRLPGHVAQSVTCLAADACLTSDPGVVSSIPVRLSATNESMCMKYWLTACSSLPRETCG